jgi:phosphoglycolate phosphatase-like HAD superfamily hydrolase
MDLSIKPSGININQETQYLVLFDHDGTTCLTNDNAYESIKYAVREASKVMDINLGNIEEKWDQLFHECRGTTELYFIKVVFNNIANHKQSLEDFANLYYTARANWYKNMKSYNHYTYDTYYPDAENLIFHCWKTPNIHIGILTGNPEDTMKERLATHLSEIFFSSNTINTFGNEASSREELINLAVAKAESQIPNFKVNKINNVITNVIYIGDSRADLYACIDAHLKNIWVPSRTLQNLHDAMSEDSVMALRKLLPSAILITNNLESPEVKNFLVA